MGQDEKTILETEWTYLVDTEELDSGVTKLSISPNEEEARRLAQRLGIVSLDRLKADVTIARNAGEVAFHVSGTIDAQVTQNCVVTMDPVVSETKDDFEAWFADPEAAISITKARHEKLTEKGHGEQPILEESEDPEALADGKIDLGELVTQYLSLAIEPYPRGEGVAFEEAAKAEGAEDEVDLIKNPFAALKDWKDKLTSGEN